MSQVAIITFQGEKGQSHPWHYLSTSVSTPEMEGWEDTQNLLLVREEMRRPPSFSWFYKRVFSFHAARGPQYDRKQLICCDSFPSFPSEGLRNKAQRATAST